jgi:glycosyltransferase involved in cell wall biosynthesis
MKKILFIAFYFPPAGGAGVQRSLKHVKYLPSFGYEPVVVSAGDVSTNLIDDSLCNEIPSGLKVFYLPSFSILNLKKHIRIRFLNKIINFTSKLLIPDTFFFWYFFNRKFVLDVLKKEKIDIVYTTSFPFSAHLFGIYLKRKIKHIKWISDFRDEWINNAEKINSKNIINNNPIRTFIEKTMEKSTVEKSTKIVSVSSVIENNFKSRYPIYKNKFETITNGYDENDFKDISGEFYPSKEEFKILYYGSLYGAQHPYHFFEAFSNFQKKEIKENITVEFIGKIDKIEQLKKYLKDKNLDIGFTDYINHNELLKKASSSNLLLLFISNAKNHEGVFTGKIFEYIRLNIPILAMIAKKGVAHDLIIKTGTGFVTEFDDVVKIENILSQIYDEWKNKRLFLEYKKNKNWEEVEKYERKKLTERLVEIIEK